MVGLQKPAPLGIINSFFGVLTCHSSTSNAQPLLESQASCSHDQPMHPGLPGVFPDISLKIRVLVNLSILGQPGQLLPLLARSKTNHWETAPMNSGAIVWVQGKGSLGRELVPRITKQNSSITGKTQKGERSLRPLWITNQQTNQTLEKHRNKENSLLILNWNVS